MLVKIQMNIPRKLFKIKATETFEARQNLQIWVDNLGPALYNPIEWRWKPHRKTKATYRGSHRLRALEALDFNFVYAYQIFGRPNLKESGKISAAGPATNITLGIIFTVILLISSGYVKYISFFLVYVNSFLAFFNLLPFGPMDGLKIFRWRKEIWIILCMLSISFLIYSYLIISNIL